MGRFISGITCRGGGGGGGGVLFGGGGGGVGGWGGKRVSFVSWCLNIIVVV